MLSVTIVGAIPTRSAISVPIETESVSQFTAARGTSASSATRKRWFVRRTASDVVRIGTSAILTYAAMPISTGSGPVGVTTTRHHVVRRTGASGLGNPSG